MSSFPHQSSDIRQHVFLDRLRKTGQLVPSSWFIVAPLIAWMGFLMIRDNSHVRVILWVLVSLVLTTARALVGFVLRRATPESDLLHLEIVLSLLGLVSALSISIGIVDFSAILSISWQVIFTTIVSVLAMGSTFTLSYSPMSFFSYMPFLVIPLSVAQVLHTEMSVRSLGFMGLVFAPVLSFYYYKQYKVIAESLSVFYEHRMLYARQFAIFDSAPDGILLTYCNAIVDANHCMKKMFGYSFSQFLGMDVHQLFADTLLVNELSSQVMHGQHNMDSYQVVEIQAVRSDGNHFWVKVSCGITQKQSAQKEPGLVWIVSDLTERKLLEDSLRRRESMYRDLVEVVNDLVFYLDKSFHFSYVNPRGALRLLGRKSDELVGHPIHAMISNAGDFLHYFNSNQLSKPGAHFEKELKVLHADGSTKPVCLSLTPLFDLSGVLTGCVGVATDVTPVRELEDHMLYLAMHDELTGLPNRRLFMDRLQQAIRQLHRTSQYLAVFMVDLDGFKTVNDTLGHSVGDLVLEMSAYRLRSVVRDSDTVARLGGDEFTLLVPQVSSLDEVFFIAQRVVDVIAEPLSISAQKVQVYASVGVSLYPADGTTAESLCAAADEAMYRSKQSGCNCYHFYGDVSSASSDKRSDRNEQTPESEDFLSSDAATVVHVPPSSLL